ncbi:MAG: dihydroorotate dehydrogenase [Solirubrobacterales bacterium]
MKPVDFCGIPLRHAVINGSGTFDLKAAVLAFGEAVRERFPFAAFVSKTITLEPRAGNPPPRLYETPAGMINSIGLPGPGVDGYLEADLPELSSLGVPLFTNVMGSSAAEVWELFDRVEPRPEIAAVELNVSCPNVRTGLDIGSDPSELTALLEAVRPRLSKPLIVKLTPNVTDVAEIARAAEAAGADALSLVNTLRAWAPHPDRPGDPWLGAGRGGLSGPAIRAVALSQVEAVASSTGLPVVGMGGVSNAGHAREFLAAGATIVAVGTESFRDPLAGAAIADGLG